VTGDRPAYLDCAATTPMRPAAVEAMLPLLRDGFGNPSGGHAVARAARKVLEEARETVALCLGAHPHEIVFTAGGTEADNLAVRGAIDRHGGVAVCSAAEHHAVLDPVRSLGGRVVATDELGRVDSDALRAVLDDGVTLVSVLLANNETGVNQPLTEVADIVRDLAPRALLHTDAVQGVCWLDVAALTAVADLVSISAHKFGGPKGVGVLVVRRGVELAPLLLGGGQEHERRSGTQNVAGIAAAAVALHQTVEQRDAVCRRVRAQRDRLEDGLLAAVEGMRVTSPRAARVAGTCHVVIPDVLSESLLLLMERGGVMASAASSCASGAMEPSHVLAAMGVPSAEALGSLRLSLGAETTDWEIDRALQVIPAAVAQLREATVRPPTGAAGAASPHAALSPPSQG
jgi:cysteine desulfurase